MVQFFWDVGFMYLGEFTCKIDSKGRIFVPAQFKNMTNGNFVITFIDKDTLVFADCESWSADIILSNLTQPFDRKELILKYIKLKSRIVECDSQGRAVIPSVFFKQLSFSEECTVCGDVNVFWVLNKEKFAAEKSALMGEVSEFLKTEEGDNFYKSLIPFKY